MTSVDESANPLQQDHVKEFLHDLLLEAGFSEEEDNIEMLLHDLEPIFLDTITSDLLKALPGDKQDRALDLLESENFDGFFELCSTSIPSYDQKMDQIIKSFADDYLSNFAEN